MFKPKPRRSDRVKDIQLKEETDFGRVNFQQLGRFNDSVIAQHHLYRILLNVRHH